MIVILGGVSGTGKSTVGIILARRLGWVYEDSDALHSATEIAKMRSGVPLTDAERWPWLDSVAAWIDERIAAAESAVVACSVLKRSYRDFLRKDRPGVEIVMLEVDAAMLMVRLTARRGHFFPARLLASQLAALEPPAPGEPTLVIPVHGTPARTAEDIIDRLHLAPSSQLR
jgi:gluconokinase